MDINTRLRPPVGHEVISGIFGMQGVFEEVILQGELGSPGISRVALQNAIGSCDEHWV